MTTVNPRFHALTARKEAAELNGAVPASVKPGNAKGEMNVRVHAPRVDRNLAVALSKQSSLADFGAASRKVARTSCHNAPLVMAAPAKGERTDSRGRKVFFI